MAAPAAALALQMEEIGKGAGKGAAPVAPGEPWAGGAGEAAPQPAAGAALAVPGGLHVGGIGGDADGVAAATAQMTPDLSFLLDESGVPAKVRPLLVANSATSVQRLSLLADSRAELKEMISDEWGFKGPEARALGVSLGMAWVTAQTRVTKETEAAAEQRAAGRGPQLARSVHTALRSAVEAQVDPLEDRLAPSNALVDKVLGQVEESHLEAIPLSAVDSQDDPIAEADSLALDAKGGVTVKRRRLDRPLPHDAESLRTRLRLWGMAYTYARARHPNQLWLTDAGPATVHKYIDHMLSDRVLGFSVPGLGSAVVPWSILLPYDLQIRREQARLVNSGMTFGSALIQASKDPELRERYFVSPLLGLLAAGGRRGGGGGGGSGSGGGSSGGGGAGGTGGGGDGSGGRGKKRKAGGGGHNAPAGGGGGGAPKQAGGGGRGSGGGKGGGGGRGAGKHAKAGGKVTGGKTEHKVDRNGREVCFKFNRGQCDGVNCGRAHCCTSCLGKHPATECRAS